jgi:broad specificity phosphatase PhoE
MIYLARHGETYWNKEGRIQGHTEAELTPRGINQINWLGKYFKSKGIQSIICSELGRSQKTAELINRYHHLPLEINPNINECNWGKWEGLTYSEIKDKFPDEYKSRETDMWYFRPYSGESYDDLCHRLKPTATEFVSRAGAESLIVVGHAMINKILIGIFLDLRAEEIMTISHPHNIIYLIRPHDSSQKSCYVNHSGSLNNGYIKSKKI